MLSQGILFCLAAYLFGSIPFGKLIAKKVAGIDITTRGSKNIGATNVAREVGVFWGIVTLLLDMLKGYLPMVLYGPVAAQSLGGHDVGLSFVAISAIAGHQFSIFLTFKGGKGVGTATGIYLALSPLACLAGVILFILILYKWDFVSLGSTVSASAMPVLLVIFGVAPPLIIASLLLAALIDLKHWENFKRMLMGKERKWRERGYHPNKSRSLSNSSSE